jgi:hypothetical protein
MAKVNEDHKYKSYRDGYGLKLPVQDLLSAPIIKLINGGWFKELKKFQNCLSDF